MYPIKIYAELHWGRRRPQFETRLNGQILNPKSTEVVHTFKYQEDIVFEFEGDLDRKSTRLNSSHT